MIRPMMWITKEACDGFALLTVLIFLVVFSLMSVSRLMNITFMIKSNGDLWQRDTHLYSTKQMLQAAEANIPNALLSCRIPVTSATFFSKQPISWWQAYACRDTLNDVSYYYVVESLGSDPCGRVKGQDEDGLFIPQYFRMTLASFLDTHKGSKIILQSTVVKASDPFAICKSGLHDVGEGRQMWRMI